MAKKITRSQIRKARLLALVVPAAERDKLARLYGVRPAGLSATIGFFEFFLGVGIFLAGYPSISGVGGAFGLLLWILNPISWLGLMTMAVAVMRIANYLAHDESFGEPLVWLVMRLCGGGKLVRDGRQIRATFGPERADRIVVDDDDQLVLLASRSKQEWDEYRTVRVEDAFFWITSMEERVDGPYGVFAYILQEVPESETLRGIVHTDAVLPDSWTSRAAADGGIDDST